MLTPISFNLYVAFKRAQHSRCIATARKYATRGRLDIAAQYLDQAAMVRRVLFADMVDFSGGNR